MNKKGLSLLEILVSAILLALLILGLANIFVATRRLVFHIGARLTAAEISRRYLDPFYMQVSAANWGVTTPSGNCSRMFVKMFAAPYINPYTESASNTIFTPNYNPDGAGADDIDDVNFTVNPGESVICRVALRVNWDERTAQ